jgi:murein DD-endopeptidase MepM/ murein hydrolase activator NlpD
MRRVSAGHANNARNGCRVWHKRVLVISLLLTMTTLAHAETVTVDQPIASGKCGVGVRGAERILVCRDESGKLHLKGPLIEQPASAGTAQPESPKTPQQPASFPPGESTAASKLVPDATLATMPPSTSASVNPVVPNGYFGELRHGTYPSPGVGDGDWTHAGIDIVAPCGSPVYAATDGRVTDVIDDERDRNFDSLGYTVMIADTSGLLDRSFHTLFLHLQSPPLVKLGDTVAGGKTRIGSVGDTGKAAGCHTHFEVRRFPDRLFPDWGNIYGRGDQRDTPTFKENWYDPVAVFEKLESPTATIQPRQAPSTLGPRRPRVHARDQRGSRAPPAPFAQITAPIAGRQSRFVQESSIVDPSIRK